MPANEKTAAQLCQERMRDIAALLDQIGQEVDDMRREYKDGLDWALAGSLGKAKEYLVEALTSISALSRKEINEALDDLRGLNNSQKNERPRS
jgi:hypothetical protein